MLRKLLPLLLALVGLGGGVGAGLVLRPAPDHTTEGAEPVATGAHGDSAAESVEASGHDSEPEAGEPEYVKLSNQFVIPVVEQGKVVSMVILALTLEVGAGTTDAIYAREPKLRDAFLQVLFDHANSGGFDGSFTDAANLVLLRKALLEAAQTAIGPDVSDVLISDIARQDS